MSSRETLVESLSIAKLQGTVCLEYLNRKLNQQGAVYVFCDKKFLVFDLTHDGQLGIKCRKRDGELYGESAFEKVNEVFWDAHTLGIMVKSKPIQSHLEKNGEFRPESCFATSYKHRQTGRELQVF